MYIANHYVKINGKTYRKGEHIPEGLSDEKADWLIRNGAVSKAAPDPAPEPEGDIAGQKPGEQAEPEVVVPEEPEAVDEEAPEIDVMAGIVQNTGKPSRRSRKRQKGGDSDED